MPRKYPRLKCNEVKKILKKLGFEERPQKGTSHQHYISDRGGKRYKVTVDCPKAPFSVILMKSMIRQSGYSLKEWLKHKK